MDIAAIYKNQSIDLDNIPKEISNIALSYAEAGYIIAPSDMMMVGLYQ